METQLSEAVKDSTTEEEGKDFRQCLFVILPAADKLLAVMHMHSYI